MCITSLPYCPPHFAEKIPEILESAANYPSWDNTDLSPSTDSFRAPIATAVSTNMMTSHAPLDGSELSGPGPAVILSPISTNTTSTNRQQHTLHSSSPVFPSPGRTALPRRQNNFSFPLSPSSPTTRATPPQTPTSPTSPPLDWFYCTRLTQNLEANDTPQPSTCPNLEIRHPGFNGATCNGCTDAARSLCRAAHAEEERREAQRSMLKSEIERLEGVVKNMKRKLESLDEGIEGGGNGQKGKKARGNTRSGAAFGSSKDDKKEWYGGLI